MDEGVKLLTVAKDAQRLFEKRPAADKRCLLNFVLSNSTWRGGQLTPTFRQPFNLIAEMSGVPPDEGGGGGADSTPRSEWWARQDSNLQPNRYERLALTIELQAPPLEGGDAACWHRYRLSAAPARFSHTSAPALRTSPHTFLPRSAARSVNSVRRPALAQLSCVVMKARDVRRISRPRRREVIRYGFSNLASSSLVLRRAMRLQRSALTKPWYRFDSPSYITHSPL